MSNIYTIHPPKSEMILFYEVVEAEGENTWGGADAGQAIQWLTHAPVGSRILVSAWDSDEEDAHLVGQTLDITDIVRAASLMSYWIGIMVVMVIAYGLIVWEDKINGE